MEKIFVAGAGTMGSGIAHTFARSGYKVILWDLKEADAEKGRLSVEKNLQRLVAGGKLSQAEKEIILSNIEATDDLTRAKEAALVIEAIIENMEIKKQFFKTLDEICEAEAILATNTSSLSVTEVAGATDRPEQVIGIHFFNPVPVMGLVEIINGIKTSEDTQNRALDFCREVGKTPVIVKEAPGFVVNRILIPMINEAIGILADGVATAEDIDESMKKGANHPIGPLALADLIGNDVCLAIMEVLYQEYGDSKYRPHPLLKKMVRGGLLGRKSKKGFFEY